MADLMLLEGFLKIFQDASAVPADGVTGEAERFSVQLSLDLLTKDVFTLAAGAVGQALPALPHAPYNGIFYLETNYEIKANINSQGYQNVKSVLLSLASVTTVLLTNDIIPPGLTAVQPARIRYIAGKLP